MTFDSIIDSLLVEFPELRSPYREKEWYLGGLPYLVLAHIFVPYILELAKRDNASAALANIFRFVERMLTCPDRRVRELADVSLLEDFLELQHDAQAILRPYFGPETLKLLNVFRPDKSLSTEEQ